MKKEPKHIDGCKTNNDLLNLFLTNFKGHKKAHYSLQNLGYELYKKGIIKFDRERGEYYLNEEFNDRSTT